MFYSTSLFSGGVHDAVTAAESDKLTPFWLCLVMVSLNLTLAIPAYWKSDRSDSRPFLSYAFNLRATFVVWTCICFASAALTKLDYVTASAIVSVALHSIGFGSIAFTTAGNSTLLEQRIVGLSISISMTFFGHQCFCMDSLEEAPDFGASDARDHSRIESGGTGSHPVLGTKHAERRAGEHVRNIVSRFT